MGLPRPVMVKPRNPFKRATSEGIFGFAGCPVVSHLSFIQAVNRFGLCVVVAVTLTADRGLNAYLGQSLAIAEDTY
jgi:hypothetical protein